MYISYDYYRIFYYVAKYGNITQAAKILLNNQPNLTRAIKTLESELGCPLFIRNNRGMKLTPEGERLFEHIRIAFENIEAGEAEIIESRNLEKGTVFVAASEVALHCVLLPVLKQYRTLYPGIRLKISNHSTPQAVDAIKNGIADIAVVTTPTLSSAMTEEVTVRKFHEVAVCSAAFSELLGEKVGFAELLSYPMISLGTQTKSFELYSEFFAEEGLHYHPETEAATADQILPMVKADLGIGFIPREFLQGVEGVFVIETEKSLPEREIRIVKRHEQTLSIAAKELERLILKPQGTQM
jgi:DNA-binding transcriptional LysR family regulator